MSVLLLTRWRKTSTGCWRYLHSVARILTGQRSRHQSPHYDHQELADVNTKVYFERFLDFHNSPAINNLRFWMQCDRFLGMEGTSCHLHLFHGVTRDMCCHVQTSKTFDQGNIIICRWARRWIMDTTSSQLDGISTKYFPTPSCWRFNQQSKTKGKVCFMSMELNRESPTLCGNYHPHIIVFLFRWRCSVGCMMFSLRRVPPGAWSFQRRTRSCESS